MRSSKKLHIALIQFNATPSDQHPKLVFDPVINEYFTAVFFTTNYLIQRGLGVCFG
jgi:hypothetical protein